MTKAEAIERLNCLNNKCDPYECIDVKCYKCDEAVEMAIKALEQEPKWVPVIKALPIKGVKVLVQSSYPNLTYVAEIGSFLSQPEGWRTADGYERIEQTVAWMPLPKPYKEETEQWR